MTAFRPSEDHPSEAQQPALGHWEWEAASGVVTWSDEVYRILDVRADEITPSYEALFRRVHPAHRGRAERLFQAAFVDRQPCVFDCPLTAADGGERWISASCAVDVDAAGAPFRMHGTVQDATHLKGLAAPASVDDGDGGSHDPLTGLANWQLFAGRVAAALDRVPRNGEESTAVLVVDIDEFHKVNDRFGHETADLVLVEVARRLSAVFRPWDTVVPHSGTVARLGGDRFMVLCEGVRAHAVVASLCHRVADLIQSPVALGTNEMLLTAGIGVSLALPGETDVATLIEMAETAVRLAKQQGHGAHVVFAPDMQAADCERDESQRALRHALAGDEFRLHYQPKVALETDRIVGVEALLRWQHPQRGMVAPLEFIPMAEATGLIVPIGAWVIQEACREASRWRRSFPDRPVLQVSVNVSARQFGPGLVDVITGALFSSGVEPQALCVEVTESLLMDDVKASVAILRELAGLGVALSIDDFGTGYSSLAHLKRFPLHELKVDRSFIDGLGRDTNDSAIVAAVIALAHALELSVVAEGVETAEQLQRLRTLGCEQAQGYFFARPGPPETIDALLNLGAGPLRHGLGAATADEASQAGRPERILVVDDDDQVRQLALMSLTAVGFEVHEAADGQSALTTAKRVSPSCVLLDLVLPDISGLELCRVLRDEPATSASTLLMLTSSDGAADKVAAFLSGADDYITKPFSPRNLASRVSAAMRRRREECGSQTQWAGQPDAISAARPQWSAERPAPR